MLGAAVAAPEQAAAQDATLVSNVGQTRAHALGFSSFYMEQGFTTGANGSAGFTLSSVELRLSTINNAGAVSSVAPVVKIYSGSARGTLVATLAGPSDALPAGTTDNYTFSVPAGTTVTLADSTSYWVVADKSNSSEHVSWEATAANGEDATGRSDWAINNNGGWSSSGTGTFDNYSTGAFQIRVNGDAGGTPTNAAPVVAIPIPDQTATEGALFSYAFPDTTLTDADSGDTLSYTATKGDDTSLPTWLGFDADTRTFKGTPAATDVETVVVKVIADDSNGGTISDEFNIVVSADPVAHCDTTDTNEIWCAALTVGQNSSGFYGYSLSEYGSVAPALFTYRTATISLISFVYVNTQFRFDLSRNSGTIPSDGLLGANNFSLEIGTGADKKTFAINNPGTNNSFTFTNHGLSWSVNEVVPVKLLLTNNAPTVANAIPDQTATEGEAFSYQFPANTFNDVDTSDTLIYTATKGDDTSLPTWLGFDADTRTFKGTPAATDVETVVVKVIADDSNGGTISDEFNIVVEADTTPPTLISATVYTAGEDITLTFSEDLQEFTLPPASAFTVTADGSAVTVSIGIHHSAFLDIFSILVSPIIRQGQTVVVTYTDPSTGDDTNAIQDAAGNDAATFTTGMSGVPAVTNTSTQAVVAPDAPTGLTATASGTTTINLSWTAPASDGGSAITGYKIEVSTDSGATWTDQVANTASTTTTYEHTGLAASTRRDYRVSAINSIGTSTSSDAANATTGTAANNAPIVAIPIPDQTATEGALFSYAFPDTTFTDADSGDTLSYTATKGDGTTLPTWLTFTPATRAFTGTPAATDVETVSVKVTADDSNGGLISDVFDIVVAADTTPPTLISATVLPHGGAITLGFTEFVKGSFGIRPPDSAFTVTADGIALPAVTGQFGGSALALSLPVRIRQGQVVVMTYTDPTTGDDTLAIQDASGNDAVSFTTGVNSVPAVINNSTQAARRPERPDGPHGNRQRDRHDQPLVDRPGQQRRPCHHRLQDRGLHR